MINVIEKEKDVIRMRLFKKKSEKKKYIYLTPIGKLVALGEASIRAKEEGITLQEFLEKDDTEGK